ncbi:hypothetical protein LWI29_018250 [Acer saccharum]|uniref:Uncharacterized protein n=1 Tax=Acer saccharum TaxID=4024 RepID=A0AA39W9H8_ACESA|nr:hypothetical protein LWI29_018250 [Acer saccharum]
MKRAATAREAFDSFLRRTPFKLYALVSSIGRVGCHDYYSTVGQFLTKQLVSLLCMGTMNLEATLFSDSSLAIAHSSGVNLMNVADVAIPLDTHVVISKNVVDVLQSTCSSTERVRQSTWNSTEVVRQSTFYVRQSTFYGRHVTRRR